MFQDLDATLAKLIEREVAHIDLDISFATDGDHFPPSLNGNPIVHFFLYHIQENTALRRTDWIVERRDDGTASRSRPPVRVDCAYVVTVWPASSEPATSIPAGEHHLLGEVMKALLRHRKLPADVLQGELVGQEPPVRASIIRDSHMQSLGEFWQAMGTRPRAVLDYTVTISVDPTEPQDLGPVVQEHLVTMQTVPAPPGRLDRSNDTASNDAASSTTATKKAVQSKTGRTRTK